MENKMYIFTNSKPRKEKNGHYSVEILCNCGNKKYIRLDHLNSGKIKSCGCYYKESRKNITVKHGHNRSLTTGKTITYNSWQNMRKRCMNPKSIQFKDYGGRGIKICDDWNKFENFLRDMGERPIGMSIDRINVNGNYEKNNCKWSTRLEQANNKRK